MLRTCFRMRTHVRMHAQKMNRCARESRLNSYPRAPPKCADVKENVQKIIFYGLWKYNNHHHHNRHPTTRNKKIFILSYRLPLPFFSWFIRLIFIALRYVSFRWMHICITVTSTHSQLTLGLTISYSAYSQQKQKQTILSTHAKVAMCMSIIKQTTPAKFVSKKWILFENPNHSELKCHSMYMYIRVEWNRF